MKLRFEKPDSIAYTLIFIALVLSITGFVLYKYEFNNIEKERKEELKVITQYKLLNLSLWLDERFQFANSILNNKNIIGSFYKTISEGQNNSEYILQNYLLSFNVKNILLLNNSNEIVSSVGKRINFNKNVFNDFEKTESIKTKLIGKDDESNLLISLILPLKHDDEIFGNLLFIIDPDEKLKPFLELSHTNLNSLNTLILYKNDDVKHPFTVLSSCSNFSDKEKDFFDYKFSQEILQKENGYFTGTDKKDDEILAYFEMLPGTPFYLISKINKQEIIDNTISYTKILIGILLLLFSVSALIIFLFWRNNKLKFFEREYEFEKEKNILLKHFDYISRYANDIIILLDHEGKIQEVNEKTLNVYGYSKKELVGKFGNILRPQKLKDEYHNILNQNIPGGIIYKTYHQKKNGETFPVEVSLRSFYIGESKHFQAIIRDITEREKAEKLIQQHSIMLDSVGQSVMAADLQGNIIYWNKASEKLFGWSKDEIQSKDIFILIFNFKNKFFSLQIINELKNGDNWSGEFTAIRKDGTLFPNKITYSPVINSFNELAAIVIVSEDLTESKERETEILLAKQKAEELNNLKSTFLSNMSHELRTPLIGILGYAEMILDEEHDEELKEKVGIIYKSGKKLNETLDTILDISGIESSKVDIKNTYFNLNELINESVILYRGLAEEKGIALKYFSGTNGLMVEFDRRIFSKIINNLLSNAVKYTNDGEINISTNFDGEKIKIIVEDTGIGIPEDKMDIIFEPFRQVSEGFNRRFEGMGLGLSITKMFVEKFNGTIQLESNPDEGSRFTIELPLIQKKYFK